MGEMNLREIDKAVNDSSATTAAQSILEPTVTLLNFRDALISLLLNGLLFQKAVLDWDLKTNRNYADGPMAEMNEAVVNTYTKTEMVPEKYITDIPGFFGSGPFTFDKKVTEGKETARLTP